MGIAALPANAILTIGSTQCLTDPASLVKELVDNALDAGATSISVEITANTIDRIEVRDNGHGIAPEDRSLVCKRHYTNKIRSLEDLHNLGGQSLGFRGEALSSAAEMSAKVLLSTRIEGEPTGAEIEYNNCGLVKGEKRLSHPVGTTAQITDFLSKVPVRKQTAEKHSAKCLTKIRRLLQGYVLARPHIRLSLKLLKAKSTKGDWSYAPRAGVSSKKAFMSLDLDTAIKVFGTKAAEALQYYTFMGSPIREVMERIHPEKWEARTGLKDVYQFECFAVDPECADMTPVSGLGQYISIDSRPVSCVRGILKSIGDHYKSCVRPAADRRRDAKIIDPLLVMNIYCPKGSYDVNVEPAKDDVLFTDAKVVLSFIQTTLSDFYEQPTIRQKDHLAQPRLREDNDFEVLLSKKTIDKDISPSRESPLQVESESGVPDTQIHLPLNTPVHGLNAFAEETFHDAGGISSNESSTRPVDEEDEVGFLAKKRATWKASMCQGSDDGLEPYSPLSARSRWETEPADEVEDLQSIELSNPWTYAKLNAHFRTPQKRVENDNVSTSKGHLPTPRQQRGDVANMLEVSSDNRQKSPSTSPTLFPYPLKAFGKRQVDDNDTPQHASDSKQIGSGALDSWVLRSDVSNSPNPSERGKTQTSKNRYEPPPDVETIRSLSQHGMALHDIPDVSQRSRAKTDARRQRTGGIDKSSIKSVDNPERVWFDIGESANSFRSQQSSTKTKPRRKSINLRESESDVSPSLEVQPGFIHPDLAIALDYEARKVKATQDHRDNLRREKAADIARKHAEIAKQRTLDSLLGPFVTRPMPYSPHRNRQAKAIAALQGNAVMSAGNAIKSTEEATRSLSKQRKSIKLPLESLEEEDWVSDLILPFATTQEEIMDQMQKMADWDDYVYQGEFVSGLDDVDRGLLSEWELQLRRLIKSQYRKEHQDVEDGRIAEKGDFVLDLCGILLDPDSSNA